MKLLTEDQVNSVELVTEATADNTKAYYLTGPFLQAEVKNRNGRIYPMNVMEKAVSLYIENNINTKRAYGELNHPEGPEINLDRVSHIITELKLEGNTYMGKARILEGTPCGTIVAELLKAGANLGVSSRGMGTVKESNGVSMVQEDFRIATAADVVADPSAPDAFVQGLMEETEWIWDRGIWKVQNLEEAKKKISMASSRQLFEAKVDIFNEFLKNL